MACDHRFEARYTDVYDTTRRQGPWLVPLGTRVKDLPSGDNSDAIVYFAGREAPKLAQPKLMRLYVCDVCIHCGEVAQRTIFPKNKKTT